MESIDKDKTVMAIELPDEFNEDGSPTYATVTARIMNTHPAPAATDTGLETAGWEYRYRYHLGGDDGWSQWSDWQIGRFTPTSTSYQVEERELVTRSQAEELLAAERAEKEEWKRRAEYAERELANSILKGRLLEADNAAQAERIKELEKDIAKREEHRGKLMKGYRSIEAKLSAALEGK